ncbi:LOB domain-containing protein 27 [Malania oleifera]|uniref:LOB domain-containing protein 27 n=1 Tax=Malania oleifera TaxID=397392 RepID=UPI0025ADC27B|nr:LOB domain-containing protein 27 [Malania oleifera]
MTLKGGTSQACAACKYQRRKCTSECPLAPFFPADNPKIFQNAHRLFGVKKMLKILDPLDPDQKAHAMDSIIFQANTREMYPVHGCCWVIRQLYFQIQQFEEELHAVRSHLAIYRQHHHEDSAAQLQLGMVAPPPHFQSYNALPIDPAAAYIDSKDNLANSLCVQVQTPYPNNANNNNIINSPIALQSQLQSISLEPPPIQQEPAQMYDEAHPIFDTIDDRQSYVDSKDAYDSSSESSLKAQSIEHVAENELKSAAACFSLTSVN